MAAVLNYLDGDVENEPIVVTTVFVEDVDTFEIALIVKQGATMPTTGGGI